MNVLANIYLMEKLKLLNRGKQIKKKFLRQNFIDL